MKGSSKLLTTIYLGMIPIFVLFFLPVRGFSQPHSIRMLEEKINHDSYVNVIFMSQGPIEELTSGINDTTLNRSFRVLIIGSSIIKNKFQGQSISVEEFISGAEGCCKRLVSSRKVDLADLMRRFNIESEPFGMQFIDWLSAQSFDLKLCNKKFRITDLGKETPLFSRIE